MSGTSTSLRSWGRALFLAAGACDTTTGVLLLASPATALGLMRVGPAPFADVGLRFVGAFVAGVGLAYLLPFVLPGGPARRLGPVAESTALIRAVVAAFVTAAVAGGELAAPWMTVAVTDAVLCLTQLFLLKRGAFIDGR